MSQCAEELGQRKKDIKNVLTEKEFDLFD